MADNSKEIDELTDDIEELKKEAKEAQDQRDQYEKERDLWEEYAIDLGTALDKANEKLREVYRVLNPEAKELFREYDVDIDEPKRPKGI